MDIEILANDIRLGDKIEGWKVVQIQPAEWTHSLPDGSGYMKFILVTTEGFGMQVGTHKPKPRQIRQWYRFDESVWVRRDGE